MEGGLTSKSQPRLVGCVEGYTSIIMADNDPKAKVSCPVCNAEVQLSSINAHLDSGCKVTDAAPIAYTTSSSEPSAFDVLAK